MTAPPAEKRGERTSRLRSTPTSRVAVLTAAMAVGAVLLEGLFLEQRRSWTGSGGWIAWMLLVGGFVLTEVFVVHVQFRRGAHTFSISELPIVLGLFSVSPLALLTARLVGSGLALVAHRRQRGIKLGFNLAMFALEAALVSVVFELTRGTADALEPATWFAAFGAMLAGTILSTTTVSMAIALHEGRLELKHVGQIFATGVLLNALTNTSIALMAIVVVSAEPRAIWLLAVVVVILYLAYRGYGDLRRRYASLESLYDFTRSIGRSLQFDPMVRSMLTKATELLRAETAELVLVDLDGAPLALRQSGEEGQLHRLELSELDARPLLQEVMNLEQPVLLARVGKTDHPAGLLGDQPFKDALVVPLLADRGVIGAVAVRDRLGDVSTFDEDDLKLFQTLANHAAVSIANGRLLERLRDEAAEKEHQALHDALTGLPNRTFFSIKVSAAVAGAGAVTRKAAVMLIDLDRFKEVNDTLGHHNGDLVLIEIAQRLRAALRDPRDEIARLGGDEFAVLLHDLGGASEAASAADRLLRSLHDPIAISELALDIDASIGIAMFPDDGEDASTLLQRADVAMYAAKGNRTGYEMYSHESDQYSPRRLALVSHLRNASARGELFVQYQPKVELGTRRVTGVEALLRWRHPIEGFVPPDEFIPIAEQTGLIRQITLHVLREALEQCARWRADGLELDVAVNLSARNLLDLELPRDVARLLHETRVPASALTLELTESSMMSDPSRTVGVLARLNSLGTKLAIDDFGTGYSSLSYLKRLPVDVVKIDKSFVLNMVNDDNDAVIVRSTIDLGHNLGLRVVAEGVEDEQTMQQLASLGCDEAQGYHLSRPISADEAMAWVRAWRQASASPGDAQVVRLPTSGG